MDSLTQIVLGAAVGEAVLGKKIGHRAMIWGAFGGFLPDLDVTSSLVMDEISALAVHRGITHSIFFGATFPLLMAWLIQRFYSSGLYQKAYFKIVSSVLALGFLLVTANFLPYMVTEMFNPTLFVITLTIAIGIYLILHRFYVRRSQKEVETNYWNWYWLFFWAILTHPLLDCFTTYGTQVFLPFSDYRVAFNVISVVDPLYTVPFLIAVIVASILRRGSLSRKIVNWAGIGISSAYMLFCIYHKFEFNRIFEESLAKENIKYERYMSTPLIMNNVLWQGMAEGDSAYYQGYYSFFQEDDQVRKFNTFPKNRSLMGSFEDDETMKTLKWFTNGYYNYVEREDGNVQMNDLRFGIFGDTLTSNGDYIFKFVLVEKDGKIDMHQPGPEEGPEITEDSFKDLWNRVFDNQE